MAIQIKDLCDSTDLKTEILFVSYLWITWIVIHMILGNGNLLNHLHYSHHSFSICFVTYQLCLYSLKFLVNKTDMERKVKQDKSETYNTLTSLSIKKEDNEYRLSKQIIIDSWLTELGKVYICPSSNYFCFCKSKSRTPFYRLKV